MWQRAELGWSKAILGRGDSTGKRTEGKGNVIVFWGVGGGQ